MQNRRKLLALMGSAVPAALLASQAAADTAFTAFAFQATGATANRNMPDRLSDLPNVLDWGADPSGAGNSNSAINAAIQFVIGRGGGKLYFPPGTYKFNYLIVGHASIDVGVQLIGAGKDIVTFQGGTSANPPNGYWVSAQGSAKDCLERIDGIFFGNVQLTRTGASIVNCRGFGIEATACLSCWICDTNLASGPNNPPNTATHQVPGPQLTSIGYNLGQCAIVDCRAQTFNIGYAFSSPVDANGIQIGGATCFACSSEQNNIGMRIGWNNGSEQQAVGVTVQNFQTERCSSGLEVYNARACMFNGVTLTGTVGNPDPPEAIQGIVWATGTPNFATVTTVANHNITGNSFRPANGDGTYTLQFDIHGTALNPAGWCPVATQGAPVGDGTAAIRATVTGARTFTYPLPANPGAFVVGNWSWPIVYSVRIRKSYECCYMGIDAGALAVNAGVDFDFDSANVQHRNNVMMGVNSTFGYLLSAVTKNRAGWKFINCMGNTNASNASVVYSPTASMNFADLPGQFTNTGGNFQPGPIESQEYDIKDSLIAASTNFGNIVTPGGTNHVKVRWDGTNWRLTG